MCRSGDCLRAPDWPGTGVKIMIHFGDRKYAVILCIAAVVNELPGLGGTQYCMQIGLNTHRPAVTMYCAYSRQ